MWSAACAQGRAADAPHWPLATAGGDLAPRRDRARAAGRAASRCEHRAQAAAHCARRELRPAGRVAAVAGRGACRRAGGGASRAGGDVSAVWKREPAGDALLRDLRLASRGRPAACSSGDRLVQDSAGPSIVRRRSIRCRGGGLGSRCAAATRRRTGHRPGPRDGPGSWPTAALPATVFARQTPARTSIMSREATSSPGSPCAIPWQVCTGPFRAPEYRSHGASDDYRTRRQARHALAANQSHLDLLPVGLNSDNGCEPLFGKVNAVNSPVGSFEILSRPRVTDFEVRLQQIKVVAKGMRAICCCC